MTNRKFLYFFTCHHCLNILIYTFKCTGKSLPICMSARDDNSEGGFRQTTIRSTFDKDSKHMSLCDYVYVGAVHKSFHSPWRELAQSQFQQYYKLHSRFLRFRKFRLVISSTRGVMFNSFTHCLHFVGRWQTVQIQIRRHITKLASDQVLLCCSLEIWIKIKTPKTIPQRWLWARPKK